MANSGARRYIVCYDIADPKRLRRVHKRTREDGMALQYSVFECWLTKSRLQRLIGDLRQLIEAREDDLRIYGILSDAPIATIGGAILPEGVLSFHATPSG